MTKKEICGTCKKKRVIVFMSVMEKDKDICAECYGIMERFVETKRPE